MIKIERLIDPRPKTSAVVAKVLLLFFAIVVGGIFLMNARLTSSSARAQAERVFENTIPKDVPIKVQIKKEKEKSFKDLKNEKWAREFELELTNTGDKPIYYLDILMVTDVKAAAGYRIEFPLQYGRAELGNIVSKPRPDDIPIKAGETRIFKIHPGSSAGVGTGSKERESTTQPTKNPSIVSGTKLRRRNWFVRCRRKALPPSRKQLSGLNDRVEPPETERNVGRIDARLRQTHRFSNIPASILPVNFLSSTHQRPSLRRRNLIVVAISSATAPRSGHTMRSWDAGCVS